MSGGSDDPKRDRGKERLVRIAAFDNVVDAELARARLEDAGVRALLKNADAIGAQQGFALPLAQYLFVLEGDAERAVNLLQAEAPTEAPRHHHHPRHRHTGR